MKTNDTNDTLKIATLAGWTRDGRPCYWGKKDSGDSDSRDLTLWITLGAPKKDASNYHRVPSQDEAALFKGEEVSYKTWDRYIAELIGKSHSSKIELW